MAGEKPKRIVQHRGKFKTSEKKRYSLAFPDDLEKPLSRLAEELGVAKTALATEFLMGCVPAIQATLDSVLKAKAGKPKSALQAMQMMMQDAGFVFNETKQEIDAEVKKHGG